MSEGLDWRGILSQDKEGAKLLGARPLKFSRPDGTDQYKAMLEKISFLLTCKKEEFGDELRRNPKTGQYTTFRRQVATRAMDDSLSVA